MTFKIIFSVLSKHINQYPKINCMWRSSGKNVFICNESRIIMINWIQKYNDTYLQGPTEECS